MAPEQWTPEVPVDVRTDIYAFGCILYEMVTGQAAMPGESMEELAQAHRYGLLRNIPDQLPLEVKAMIKRCVAVNPQDRCQSWQEVEAAAMIIYERVAGQPAPLEIETRTQAEKASRPELIAAGWSYDAMGMSYFDIGNYDLAAGYFERVIWLGRQTNDPPLEGAGLSHLGNACRALSDLDGAIKYHKQQLKIARQIQAQAIEADAVGNLGNDYGRCAIWPMPAAIWIIFPRR
jgi:serine/threonine protein kinase